MVKTASPCWGVPLPGGSPAPSGPMLMSQVARSSGEIALPRLGDCWAAAAPHRATSAAAAASSRINIFHLALVGDVPARDHVAVEVAAVATQRDKLRPRRLDVAGLVGGAALQRHRAAIPLPGHAEARERLRQYR